MGTQHRWSLAVGGAAVGYVTNFIGTLSVSLSLTLAVGYVTKLMGTVKYRVCLNING